MTIDVSPDDLKRIIEALDSHVCWQLSDPDYRNDADVNEPGSDDPEDAVEIAACRELAAWLETQGE